jgi:tetratricopeptide (TPR) repeat protein
MTDLGLLAPLLVLLAARSLKGAGVAEGGEYDMGSVSVEAAQAWLARAHEGSRLKAALDQASRAAADWLQAQPGSPERDCLDRLEPEAHPEIAAALASRSGDLDGRVVHGAIIDVFLRTASDDEADVRRRAASMYYEALLRALESVPAVQSWAASRLEDLRHQRTQDVVLRALNGGARPAPTASLQALLATGTVPLPHDPLPADLLRAEHEIVGFVGRTDQLAELDAWAAKASPVAVCLFTGAGGVGKTRLAVEWCKRLRERGAAAGFLGHHAGAPDLGPLFQGTGLRAAVIDYAETRRELVAALLERMAGEGDADRPLRLLLLARGPGEWWDALGGERWEVRRLVAAGRARDLETLLDGRPARAALFLEAVREFEVHVEDSVPVAGAPDLDADHFGHPLFVQMAALAALRGLDIRGAEPLLHATLDHERSYWRRAVRELQPTIPVDDGEEVVRYAVTLLTLWGGAATRRETDEALTRAAALAGIELAERRNPLRRALLAMYGAGGAPGRELRGLEPDLLGEHLVRTVGAARPEAIGVAFDGVDERQVSAGLRVLNRVAAGSVGGRRLLAGVVRGRLDRLAGVGMGVAVESGDPIGAVLAEGLQEAGGPVGLALSMAEACPVHTVALRELAEVSTRIAKESAAEAWDGANAAQQAEVARLASNHAGRLLDLGRLDEALAATQEAVDHWQQLAASRPDAFLPDLAGALTNLGNGLSAVGRREQALAATQEAVDQYRQLAASRPDASLPDLAGSLTNLGIRLSAVGRREQALAATKEAVDQYRQLAASRPDAFLPDLAMSLNNLGRSLLDLVRREEALAATKEAVDLYRQLAAARPDAFLPGLAVSLNNLGSSLSTLGRREEALTATKEAVDHRRQLVAARPDAFLPDLASSLNNLGNILSALGCREDALAATKEAVDHYRQLAAARPDAFLPRLATSLGARGRVLAASGMRAAAAASFAEGLEAITPLLAVQPRAFAKIATMLVRDYEAHADAPDEQVLSPVNRALAKLRG